MAGGEERKKARGSPERKMERKRELRLAAAWVFFASSVYFWVVRFLFSPPFSSGKQAMAG
jgi:hypothetical protein